MSRETIESINQLLSAKIHEEIDKEVGEKIISLSRQSQAIIDEEEIRTQCTRKLIKGMDREYGKRAADLKEFYRHLESEKPLIYKKIAKAIKEQGLDDEKLLDVDQLIKLQSLLTDQEKEELHQVGIEHFNKQEFERAGQYFGFALFFNKFEPDLWFAKGMALQSQASYDEALLCYSYALAIAPHFLVVYLQMIECLLRTERLGAARELYTLFKAEIAPSDYPDVEFFQTKLDQIKQHLDKK
jgi:tetratricopeptide (TPR) repeat protein